MADSQNVVGKVRSVCGCSDFTGGGVRVDVGLLEEVFVEVGQMGRTHKGTLFRDSGDGATSIVPDLPTVWMGRVQVVKFVYKDGLDAAA